VSVRPRSDQPPAGVPAARVVGVRRLADYLKRKLEADGQLRNVSVKGEISNFANPRGNANFALKEGDTILNCFAWANDVAGFPALKNGMAVVATGSISTYAARSVYQLIVRDIVHDGVGDVHALFEERKKRLAAEGLFDPERKRPMPQFPFRVALVSSRQANGAIDFVTLLRERAPHVAVVWCETPVQGPNAPYEICGALRRASRADVDLIVVTRGGGSFEDLFAFSDEGVVRAIAAARHPVLSAIGHTVDQQLADFAADKHLETPSAAAKAIGSDTRALRERVNERLTQARTSTALRIERLRGQLAHTLVRSKLTDPRQFLTPLAQRLGDLDGALAAAAAERRRAGAERLRALVRRLDAHDPTRRLAERGRRLQTATIGLESALGACMERASRRSRDGERRLEPAVRAASERVARKLELVQAHLDGKNPEAILQRGYAIVTYGKKIVRDPAEVPEGASIAARLAHGTLSARVERNETDGNERSG
jgi:exodeoxyribonuclease VII large subunit